MEYQLIEKNIQQVRMAMKFRFPKKEFELIELFVSNTGKVFGRQQILSLLWDEDTIVGERTVDVHIRKLRERFGNEIIRTIKGVGYLMP